MGTVVTFPRERIVREQPVSKAQLATLIGRSPRWVQAQVNESDMPHERLPSGFLRFRLSAVLDWLDEQKERRSA